jgi:hypothetical protein
LCEALPGQRRKDDFARRGQLLALHDRQAHEAVPYRCAATPSQSMRDASPGPGKHNSHGPLVVASASLRQTEGVETVHQPHRT